MPITTVTYECGVPDVAQVEHLVLQVVATLTDATLGPITTTVTLGMTQTITNAFTRARHVASAVGLCGSVRLLAHTIANDDQFYTHQDECWIQAAEQTLLSYLAQRTYRSESCDKQTVTVPLGPHSVSTYIYPYARIACGWHSLRVSHWMSHVSCFFFHSGQSHTRRAHRKPPCSSSGNR